jgi:hypothetical protein
MKYPKSVKRNVRKRKTVKRKYKGGSFAKEKRMTKNEYDTVHKLVYYLYEDTSFDDGRWGLKGLRYLEVDKIVDMIDLNEGAKETLLSIVKSINPDYPFLQDKELMKKLHQIIDPFLVYIQKSIKST